MMHVKISDGNGKVGRIRSVSLPSGLTCRDDCECVNKCYARKFERMRPAVRNAYMNNYELLNTDPDVYWREVEGSIMMSRFFRFHVSGDIPDGQYLRHMVQVAIANPHCNIMCFTKKYGLVNAYMRLAIAGQAPMIPGNLHIIFSAWRGLTMVNPHHFPEAHVRYKDGSTTARDGAFECSGNCTHCAQTNSGCWTLCGGQQVVFNEH